MESIMAITDWPEGERPREKLLQRGAGALSDAELLAIFLRIGVRGKSAVDLARDLLVQFDGSLDRLFAACQQEILAIKGFGPAKYAEMQAVKEMMTRALGQRLCREPVALCAPQAVYAFLRSKLAGLPHEVFQVIYLDAQNRVIGDEELFRGTLTQTSVYPREVVKQVLARNAAAVIFAHNHPSGVAEPSQADRQLTDTLKAALGLVDVRVLDHIVAAGQETVSFAERGWL
jgi:DNA repair protein RadC